LPASSIYWHFKDKDDLIAAVIERSFASWLSAWQVPAEGDAHDRVVGMAMRIAKALLDSPDFVRLGRMLALERRPVEPRARAMFIQARAQAYHELTNTLRGLRPAGRRSIRSPSVFRAGASGARRPRNSHTPSCTWWIAV
jgi:AcrR family transcriptional regulator